MKEKGNAQNIQTPPMQMQAKQTKYSQERGSEIPGRRLCNSEMEDEKRVQGGCGSCREAEGEVG